MRAWEQGFASRAALAGNPSSPHSIVAQKKYSRGLLPPPRVKHDASAVSRRGCA